MIVASNYNFLPNFKNENKKFNSAVFSINLYVNTSNSTSDKLSIREEEKWKIALAKANEILF